MACCAAVGIRLMEVQEEGAVEKKIRVRGHCTGLALLNWLRSSCRPLRHNIPHKQSLCPLRFG